MKFEDLEIWKRATQLSIDIYMELMELKDFGFKVQITRSGLSIPSNIAEGFTCESIKECMTFLSYASGSCGELRTKIYIGIKNGYIQHNIGKEWIQETRNISSKLTGLMKTKRKFLQKT